jgi:non-lysosomal glucosylceramidase
VVSAQAFDEGAAAGVSFRTIADGTAMAGSLAVAGETRCGRDVTAVVFDAQDSAATWATFAADGRVGPGNAAGDGDRVAGTPRDPAGAVAVRVRLRPGAQETLRFSIAWDLPLVEFGGGRRWRKRYTREWGVAGDGAWRLAAMALVAAPAWRTAIEVWQAPILESPTRPDWYKAALFNELYLLVDGGTLWHDGPDDAATLPLPSGRGDLAILECYDYPFYDTLDVHFYAAFALTALWPHLQVSISRAYAATVTAVDGARVTIEATGETALRKMAGALPHDLGGPGEDPLVRVNHYRFQEVNGWKDLNPKFVLQAWRDREFAADRDGYLREVWPSIQAAMDHIARFDRDGDGLPEHDGRPDQTYDTWPMTGPSAYGGSLWLAALRAAAAFARAVGDRDRADRWDHDLHLAAESFVARLWNGRSFDFDDGGTPTSDSVMADQLVGQWYADVTGLGELVPAGHVDSALRRVYALNVRGFGDGRLGAVNGMRPDGSVDASSEQSQEVWTGTSYALAAFMIGRGLVDEGWATAEGVARVTYEHGLWFRTPEAYDRNGDFRASVYLRPLAIWAIEEALARQGASRQA